MSIYQAMLKFIVITFFMMGCSSVDYTHTVNSVDLNRFMGDWYVVAGRTTFVVHFQ